MDIDIHSAKHFTVVGISIAEKDREQADQKIEEIAKELSLCFTSGAMQWECRYKGVESTNPKFNYNYTITFTKSRPESSRAGLKEGVS